MTVRERTAPVTVVLTTHWDGADLRVVGDIDISPADYAVGVPQVVGVNAIDDAAQVEIDLTLRHTDPG